MLDLSKFRKNGQIDLDAAINKGLVWIEERKNIPVNLYEIFANGTIKKDEIEKTGTREKFWCNNYNFLYKEIYENSYEDFAELISYELAILFGIECAEYDLATHKGMRGVISTNIIKDNSGDIELVSGSEIINIVYHQHIKPLQNIYNTYINLLKEANLNKNYDNYNNLSRKEKNILIRKLFLLYKETNFSSFYLDTLQNINIERLKDEELEKYFNKFKLIFGELEILYDYNENEKFKGILKANNLFDLWYIIEKYCDLNGYILDKNSHPIETLMNYFIFDIITSQGDRHADNWSIIVNYNTNEVRISPLYDNSNMCNLNRIKAIKTIKEYIDMYSDPNMSEEKKERVKERINKTVGHAKICLKLNPEDVENRENNINQIKKFIDITDEHQLQEIISKIKFLESQIENVFTKIENKIKIEIPEMVKTVVIYTLKHNIELFLECYEQTKSRRKK